MKRCGWVDLKDEQMIKYHDNEWGNAVHDDDKLFEILSLEIMQSGLSWKTILHKRNYFREAFQNFVINQVKLMDNQVSTLLNNKHIIRNRLKIEAIINNAKIISNMQQVDGSFNDYLNTNLDELIKSKFQNRSYDSINAEKYLSLEMSKKMKKDGFKFIGPVVMHSFMQAVGTINGHEQFCDFR
ncbi:DNA-3-methyladenine glycosylase I [Apilactobacillus ozensis DSM 23829 = JCM 17196]|uniref:DNA-3-methyladenine glycosylase I n=1 Tax=Apilactobacillus ozensis DSM 23829 = JCM 17196 TaxID=1423781 RepID=A0A0R2B2J9_9LACO|nr:DNA-3-methyladenine glycosylase I [Apilactobacillus ozensis]KRM69683.1 DNA-3-methyladenine glycosylase I [Apilactobacillus ozensis DSM 23829 = JCM 17196]